MRILLTNDDGLRAEGISAMWRALRQWSHDGRESEVHVVAPETVQSATGHGVTLHLPLLTQRLKMDNGMEGVAVDGRPADCVKLALCELVPRPELVVSGINHGANVGVDVFYSGTVAAAVEAAFLGFPAIAVSMHLDDDVGTSFDWAAVLAMRVIQRVWRGGIAPGEVVSVNIPALEEAQEPAGIKVVPQCICPWNDTYERRQDPNGRHYFWNTSRFSLARSSGDTDVVALREKYITVTPLHFNLTATEKLSRLREAIPEA